MSKNASNKSARRRARELALQGLYQWLVAGNPVAQIVAQLKESDKRERADAEYFEQLLQGCIDHASALSQVLQPYLDRAYADVTPVERGVLLIGAYEMTQRLEIPSAVVINEAVELAKTFGGTDGHRYVNGVLDKLAAAVRTAEARRPARGALRGSRIEE